VEYLIKPELKTLTEEINGILTSPEATVYQEAYRILEDGGSVVKIGDRYWVMPNKMKSTEIQAIERTNQSLKRRIRALNGYQSRLTVSGDWDNATFKKRQELIQFLKNEIIKNDLKMIKLKEEKGETK
jgi:hypothetical protein